MRVTQATSGLSPSGESGPPRDCWPVQAIEDAYARAAAALDDPAALPLDAIIWLSAHLASVQRVVHPAARQALGDDPAITALGRDTIRIERELRLLERIHSGDGLVIRLDATRHTRSLVSLVNAHARDEQALLGRLSGRLSVEEQEQLVERYRRALESAPTRPHPHMPHTGRLGALAFAFDGRRDRTLDGLDGRYVPTPHQPPAPIRVHRWPAFLRDGNQPAPKSRDRAPRGRRGRP